LAHTAGREKNRVFLITSAIPGEGKTFTSSNFAAILSQQDLKTVLVDADLRKPSVSKLLFSENIKPGLSEVLLGHATLEQAIVPTKIENLWVLAAGGIAPNPSELLAQSRIKEIINQLKDKFERIVIDTSPVLAVRDPLLLAPFADAICLVARAGHSPSKATVQAVRLLSEAGAPPLGIVLNSVRQGRGSYYAYAYRAYGSYGGKGVYGESPSETDPTI
jgi:capsular exopolysaccharide synthesis family protein